MKELTIEEKAKAYDKAIKRANSLLSSNELGNAWIYKLLPELKESEDERIRKKLLSSFKDIMADADEDELWYGLPYNDIISWLEKQGNNINCIYDKELSELLHIVICRYINDPNISYSERENVSKKILPYVELLEKQGEQKSADKVEQKFKVGDIVKDPYGDLYHITEITDDSYKTDDGRFILFKNQEVYTLFKFTAWSEEDELHIRELESLVKQEWAIAERKNNKDKIYKMRDLSFFLKTLKPQLKQEWSEEDKNMLQSILDEYKSMSIEKRNWLKSLKERVQPQQKVEWSEEDETYSDHVITAIKSYYTDDLGEENPWREELLRWLKSLRPQLTWKPSKEQMITLRHVISGCSYDIDPLVELETKLKEL